MSTPLAVGALLVLAVGFFAGVLGERARRAWADWRMTKAQVPVLRAAAWLLSRNAAGAVALAVAVLVLSVYTIAGAGR